VTHDAATDRAGCAGKLADGYRGLAWGAHETLAQPDGQCQADPEPGAAWACQQTIGDVPVTAGYGYDHGVLYSVLIMAEGYTACSTLMDTLTAAWGRSIPQKSYAKGRMDDRIWVDKRTSAVWKWNRYSDKCQVVALHLPSYDAVKAAQATKAKEAIDDL
jgi:hypothetical protein